MLLYYGTVAKHWKQNIANLLLSVPVKEFQKFKSVNV